MKYFLILDLLLILGCTTNPLQQKRERIVECVKDLHNNDISEKEAFEICSRIYKL